MTEAIQAELNAARDRHEIAWQAFNTARASYMAMKIGDAAFLAAKAAYDISGAAYDAAIDAAGLA